MCITDQLINVNWCNIVVNIFTLITGQLIYVNWCKYTDVNWRLFYVTSTFLSNLMLPVVRNQNVFICMLSDRKSHNYAHLKRQYCKSIFVWLLSNTRKYFLRAYMTIVKHKEIFSKGIHIQTYPWACNNASEQVFT